MLTIKNLSVFVESKKILEKINLEISKKEIVAILGPNGSGKTTLARAILNDKRYKKTGKIIFEDKDITKMPTESIIRLGVFFTPQFIPSIEYVKTKTFLKYLGFTKLDEIVRIAKEINLREDFIERGLNENLSGGERKKFEILLLKTSNSKLAILDEIDSGLDLETVKYLIKVIKEKKNEGMSFIIISHYPTIFKEIETDKAVVLKDGKIAKTGGKEIIEEIEKNGYDF